MNSEFLMLPHFDPTIFTLGDSNIGLRWYGLMYLLGFIFARWLAVRRANQPNSGCVLSGQTRQVQNTTS